MLFYQRDPLQYLVNILALFLVLPVHEWAHAYTAYLLGDHTAKWEGRLSLNPMRHLSLMGSMCILFFGFGWAKPVPINPYNLVNVKDKKVGFAICALAGPASNFLMAIILTVLYKILIHIIGYGVLVTILEYLAVINVYLMVFNLLPIPPLDGSRIWSLFLSNETYNKLMVYESKITIIIFFLLWSGLLSLPLTWISQLVFKLIDIITWFV